MCSPLRFGSSLLFLLTVLSPLVSAPARIRGVEAAIPHSCPVTRGDEHPFIPPWPYPSKPRPDGFWFGSDRLWIQAPVVWYAASVHGSNGEFILREKMSWHRQGYDWRSEPEPPLKITGRRLDAEAAPLQADVGSVVATLPYIMAGIDIPSTGCWEVTGRYNDDELSFVVWVPALRKS